MEFPRHLNTEALPLLTAWIGRAIVEDPETLRRLLYKVDISEESAKAAAATNGPEALAILIIEREREKAISRAQYQGPPASEDADLIW